MDIVFVEPAMFGKLSATSEDHSGIDLENDVRRARIFARAGAGDVPLVRERRPGENFLDAEGLLVVGLAQKRTTLEVRSVLVSQISEASSEISNASEGPIRLRAGHCRWGAAWSGRSVTGRAWRR